MEPQGGLRSRTHRSFQSHTNHHQYNSPDAESSDEDDDDIPANKLPSVSPSKQVSLSAPRLYVDRAKRSLSDMTRGGIVFYPGPKKPRNGYNMVPVPRESLPRSTPDSSCSPAQLHSRANSLSSDTEDDVREGLIRVMNDALRQLQTRQAQDDVEQQPQPGGASTLDLLNEVQSEELEDAGNIVGSQDSGLPPAIPTRIIPCALPLNSDVSNGVGKGIKQLFQAAHCATISAGATLNRENRIDTEVQARVDAVSLHHGNIWEIPNSPGQPSAPGGHPETTSSSDQKLQPAKKRGRPPKLPPKGLSNGAPGTEKKRLGRPRKNYPRLRHETDKEYITRIARLQKKPIPSFSDSDTQLPWRPSPVLNGIQPVAAYESEQIIQGYDAHTSAHVPAVTRDQKPNVSRLPCRPCFNDNNSQLAPELDVQPKAAPEEDEMWLVNHAEHGTRDGDLDERNRDFGRDDNLAQHEAIENGDDGSVDYNTTDDDSTTLDFIDGFDSDPGSRSDVDQSAEDSFVHDVNAFNARQTRHYEDDEVFENPVDDDVLAIHLDHEPLKQLCKFLGNASWVGVKGNWQWRYFDYDDAKTRPARALLPLLTKLERIYQNAPKAPNLKEQNKFLREHTDMLRYYFYKIKIVVEHIRSERLEIPERNEATPNTDPRKRKRMTRDLVLYVIPMLAHVLASGWGLGGEKWAKTSFTSATIKLLQPVLGWIMILHRRLLSELDKCPLEEKPESEPYQQAWRRQNDRRQEIGPLVDKLCQVLSAAPDQLVEMEAYAKKELQRRQEQLEREEQLNIEQKAAEEARQASVAERKRRSLLSIRGIHYRLGSPTTSSRPSPTLTPRSTEWSIEEQRLLFLRIQASFPTCPDLNNLRWELNKTVAQTVAMTEQIIEKMLTRVLVDYSVEERAAELRRIMHSSGLVES
ncbi:hypothetical protein E0Z10_g599 [Xylaria hypoxylon]|uniref:Uncharacterized protein n=1 Tax=Xylaria hypoxylon TaxID=37992 RepID=A0A4Z0YVR5_9PEZI|nr:hypothetical protein E0Z10_g599 [Xylaria hypoxylon]